MAQQLSFFDNTIDLSNWRVDSFSFDDFSEQKERLALENKYIKITEITDEFSRQSVSYQLSKKDV